MKDRMKVYHGVPKSVPDNNTIFYASFDGSIKPEIGSFLGVSGNIKDRGYNPNVTGNGIAPLKNIETSLFRWNPSTPFFNPEGGKAFTLDVWCNLQSATFTQRVVAVFGIDLICMNGVDLYVGHWKDRKFVMKSPVGFHHFRVIVYPQKTGLTPFKVFHNGNFKGEYSINLPYFENSTSINIGHDTDPSLMSGLADLHISNIDRGDFFPNLPQDFIEGKAIIKEKFGQQQIKGDPMYSQVTELKIPHYSQANDYLYSPNNYLYNNPEAHTILGAENWNESASFKIKGLNNEIISGVIDTDTALCRVVNTTAPNKIEVGSVSALSVNDSFKLGNSQAFIDLNNRVITNIDPVTKIITCSGENVNNGFSGFLLETTTSSSSPVVKSQDGQTVVGNWSGLGTNEATFTLGTNTPSLSGKDLYVTYSLNMPSNNSHFPEIPYSVDKAFTETGVEMNPVTEIVIEDDFRGKIGGSSKECPHTYKVNTATSLRTPSEFVTEQGDDSYQRVQLVDTLTSSTTANTSGAIPQQLFSFNLIEIVERKLGCAIPSSNKVQWLRENVTKMWLNHYGYGVTPTGNLLALYIGACNLDNNTFLEWQGANPHTNHTHTSSTTKLLRSETVDGYVNNKIQKDGFVYFVAHTTASNGNMPSIINTDYVKLEVKLKLPSNYQALYCDNRRAREDKCNPVLVQKETKTVQRLLPSKESFVTESKSGISKGVDVRDDSFKILYKSDFTYLTTQGTGVYNALNDFYRESVAKLGVTNKSYMYTNDDLFITQFVGGTNGKFIKVNSTSHPLNNFDLTPTELPSDCMLLAIKPVLAMVYGELCIVTYNNEIRGKSIYNSIGWRKYPIPNRPLIK